MNEIEKLKTHLKQAMAIAEANIEKAENIDLENMAQILESFIDELNNIGDFEIYPNELEEGFIRMNQLAGVITEDQAKKMIEDLDKETSYKAEISDIIKQKNLQQGDKIKWMFSFSGWRDKTPVEHTGTFIRWGLILESGIIQPLIPKYIKSAVGITAMVKDDKIAPTKISYLPYYINGNHISKDNQKAFETLEKI